MLAFILLPALTVDTPFAAPVSKMSPSEMVVTPEANAISCSIV